MPMNMGSMSPLPHESMIRKPSPSRVAKDSAINKTAMAVPDAILRAVNAEGRAEGMSKCTSFAVLASL